MLNELVLSGLAIRQSLLAQAEFELEVFWQQWGWIPGLMVARQVLYHLSHSTSPFSVMSFFEVGSY
jgi:hypothetical protein